MTETAQTTNHPELQHDACPRWCDAHTGGPDDLEPGRHARVLAARDFDGGCHSVELLGDASPETVFIDLGLGMTLELPATSTTTLRWLAEVGRMLDQAAERLSALAVAHEPWCTEHQYDGNSSSWCVGSITGPDGTVLALHNGTDTFAPHVTLDSLEIDHDGVSLHQARRISEALAAVVATAEAASSKLQTEALPCDGWDSCPNPDHDGTRR